MNREQRVQTAQETLQILTNGHYLTPNKKCVSIAEIVKRACDETQLYSREAMPSSPPAAYKSDAMLEVTPESTFDALLRLSKESSKIGCLNFASAKNPGGGFLSGAQAQEEALTRASGLYPCLLAQPSYYQSNRTNASCLYLDLLIHSPQVPFFRNDEGELIESPFLVNVVTAPAPNAGAIHKNEPLRAVEIQPCLQRRAELVLRALAISKVESLVLGAWGCGVFRNDPYKVAACFASLIGANREYARHFKKIVFAIYDPSGKSENLAAFQEVIGCQNSYN